MPPTSVDFQALALSGGVSWDDTFPLGNGMSPHRSCFNPALEAISVNNTKLRFTLEKNSNVFI